MILSRRDSGGIVEDIVDDYNQDLGESSWFYRKRGDGTQGYDPTCPLSFNRIIF